MLFLRGLVVLTFVGLLAGCGASPDCKSACNKLSTCGLKSSGFSCDSNCSQTPCAVCVNDRTCEQVAAGVCQPECPGVAFTK